VADRIFGRRLVFSHEGRSTVGAPLLCDVRDPVAIERKADVTEAAVRCARRDMRTDQQN